MHPEHAAIVERLRPGWHIIEVGPGGNPVPWPSAFRVDLTPPGQPGTAGSQAGVICAADAQGSAKQLPCQADEFDALVAVHVLEHEADTLSVLEEWKRVVRSEGLVAVICPDQEHHPGNTVKLDPTHAAAFTPMQLGHLFHRVGFVNIGISYPVPDWSFMVVAMVP